MFLNLRSFDVQRSGRIVSARLKPSRSLSRPGLLERDGFSRAKSLACGRGERRFAALTGAHVDELGRLSNLQQVEGVRVIVDIGNRLPGDLDNDVALLKAGLLSRAATDHTAQ